MDDDEVRLSLAQSFKSPEKSNGTPCLLEMLNFIEHGTLPTYYSPLNETPEPDYTTREKSLGICKAAIVKAVVEVAGEDKNLEVLWDDQGKEKSKPGGEFIDRMIQWIRTHKTLSETNRDDLIICASLCLANLARKGERTSDMFRINIIDSMGQIHILSQLPNHPSLLHQTSPVF